VGANDGALHAFLLTDQMQSGTTIYGGTELWRFYPTEILDELNNAQADSSWNMCDDNSYCHRYFVDGSPVAGDIFDDEYNSGAGKWRTMLVCGLREGGEAYFALDITSGKAFDDGTNPSEFLWEFTDTELGQTWADPAIERVAKQGGGSAWGVFFGSGYATDNPATPLGTEQAQKEAYLFGVVAHDMAPMWLDSGTSPMNRVKIVSSTLLNDALSPPRMADFEGDYKGDAIYAGNLYGNMYRVDDIGKDMEPTVSVLYDSQNTDHSNAIRATADYAYGDNPGDIWVYFGTGSYEVQGDKYSQAQQYFFGLKDSTSGTTTYTMSDLNVLTAGYVDVDISGTTVTYRTVEDNNTSDDGNESWVIELDSTSAGMIGTERVISQPLVVGGIVFFTSFIPDDDVCAGSGDSYLFAVDFETGAVPTEPVFDLNQDGVIDDNDILTDSSGNPIPIAGIYVGSGQPSEPVLHKDTMFVTTTGGGLVPTKVDLPSTRATLRSWKEE
jgi:Tfp pilus tip-associated adhesin PilY1